VHAGRQAGRQRDITQVAGRCPTLHRTCSPYRRPRILRSRKTVKPSFSQKCSQVALVTRLPGRKGGGREGKGEPFE
jgi:hypothetical protein